MTTPAKRHAVCRTEKSEHLKGFRYLVTLACGREVMHESAFANVPASFECCGQFPPVRVRGASARTRGSL